MRKLLLFLLIPVGLLLLTNCNKKNSSSDNDAQLKMLRDSIANNLKQDSAEIFILLTDVYKWRNSKFEDTTFCSDFDVIVEDTLQTAINYNALQKTISELKKTGYFSSRFLENYKKLADSINYELTHANPKYYNEINFAFQEADVWTFFQDDVEDYWNKFVISELEISAENASLKWTIKVNGWESSPYTVKFEKEEGKWKVSYLSGFDEKLYLISPAANTR